MKAGLLLLLAPLGAFATPTPSLDVSPRQASTSIDALMKAKGKLYFGTCSDQGRLTAGKNAAIIDADFGQLTPGKLVCDSY
jgi:endo-1,4-beta-xylanase